MANEERGTVLVVEDDPNERKTLTEIVGALGYKVESAKDGAEALEVLESADIDLILTDIIMPRMDGMELLRTLASRGDRRPSIVLTAFGSIDQAIAVVHDLRAFWFLEKPARGSVLSALLERAMLHKKLIRQAELLERRLSYHGFLGELFGRSAAMQQVFSLIHRVAPTSASVLITGESGTGKELVAHTIHRLSPRAEGPFVAVNCAALPESLIESELFGHEKGAFTGAVARHAGCFEQANNGTLFLDEITEMPLPMQAKLLRALQESKVRRIGATVEATIDVRVVASTNRAFDEQAAKRVMREDLYYRLNVFQVTLPPLRNRCEDIPGLVENIIADLNKRHDYDVGAVHPDAMAKLAEHSWPGNVRELRNVLERAAILARGGSLLPEHLPATFQHAPAARPPSAQGGDLSLTVEPGKELKDIEKSYILMTLKYCGNNKALTARRLGISIRTLHNRLSEFAASQTNQADREHAMSVPN